MRIVGLLIVCLALSGCDNLVTEQPLLAKSARAPQLREGVWVTGPDKRCLIDAGKSAGRRTACTSDLALVTGDTIAGLDEPGKPPTSYRLASGSPIIAQIDLSDPSTGPEFYYGGLEPVRFGRDGKITAFRAWPVLCGPPGKPDSRRALEGPPTAKLFPGLTRLPGKPKGCTTRSVDVARVAAMRSRRVSPPSEAHWIRDR